MAGAIFLDRDGVINENRDDHVKSIREFRILPGALDAIVRLSKHYPIFVVTNQPGIDPQVVESIHTYLRDWVVAQGGQITDFYYCTHPEGAACYCRKPGPGMLQQAASAYGITLSQSIIIGDQPSDIRAGQAVGMSTVFVRSGLGGYWFRRGLEVMPDMIVDDLAMAADRILRLREQLQDMHTYIDGVGFDEAANAMTHLAPSVDASNSLKAFLSRLQPATEPAKKAMRDLGLTGTEE